LSLSLAVTSIGENGGATTATVSRNTPTTNALTVTITSADNTRLSAPVNVVIPANQSSASFTVSGIDNVFAEGDQTVALNASGNGLAGASESLTVIDDDTAALSLQLSSNTISEAIGTNSITATVSRNTATIAPLVISVNVDDSSELNVPSNVTILAGQRSATFAVDSVDDDLLDGLQLVGLTLSSNGFTPISSSITVTDNELDNDSDSIPDRFDNCPFDANADQNDLDGDSIGDVCDVDIDGDNVNDGIDNCPVTANPDQADFESDGIGDVCDNDLDGDGLPNDYETQNGLDPLNSLDRDADPDFDGFTNIEEFNFGTDPQVADRDDDNNGVPDSVRPNPSAFMPAIIQLLLLDDD